MAGSGGRLLAIAAIGVVAVSAIVVAAVVLGAGPAHAPVEYDTFDDAETPEQLQQPRVAFGDGTYLDGYDYLRGVNVYSLIFGGKGAEVAQVGESQASYDYLASRGVSIVRLAVPWQRLQEIPDGGSAADGLEQPVDLAYLDMVAEQVARAANAGIRTVIDLHNGCTYPWGAGEFVEGSLRCGDGITEQHVANIWGTIAARFRGDERVLAYDVFNEPRWSVGVDVYKQYSQIAVDAIRATGDEHTLWIEGILSAERGRLAAIAPDGPWIEDPLEKVMYSEHFYADERGASFDQVTDRTTVLAQLRTFAQWCEQWSVRCSVGEVGWPSGGPGGVQSEASAAGWNSLFEEFYAVADEYELDVTYFAASSSKQVGTLLAYVATQPGIPSPSGLDTALSQTAVIERHLSRPAE